MLDVQGAEKNVLEGGSLFLQGCRYVFLEASIADIYYNQTPKLGEIEDLLASHDFVLILKVLHGHKGLEGNCLFVHKTKVSRSEKCLLRAYQSFRSSLLNYRRIRMMFGNFFLKS